MDYDEWGEVINGENTYKHIAGELTLNYNVLVGWTDQNGTHFDILFTYGALVYGGNIQGGINGKDLFVSIMRRGTFGFQITSEDTHARYYEEKLGGSLGQTAEPLAKLINGVKRYI